MSGTGLDVGQGGDSLLAPAPGTPEYLKFMQDYLHGQSAGMSGIPPGVASLLTTPSAESGATGIGKYIPGVITNAYSGVDNIQGIAQRLLGTPEAEVKHIPGGVEAEKLVQGSLDTANSIVPHVTPLNENEAQAQSVGNMVGAMIPSIPAGVTAGLPSVARAIANTGKLAVLPGPGAIIPSLAASAALPQLLPDSAEAQTPQAAHPLTGDHYFDELPTPPVPPTTQPAKVAVAIPPTGDNYFAPAPRTGDNYFAPAPTPELSLQHTDPVAAQDPSTWPWWKVLTGLGVGVAAIAGGKRIVPFGLDLAKEKFFPGGTDTLPGTAGSVTTQFRQATVDSNAMAKEHLKSTADTPTIGTQLAAKYGDITSNQSSIQRYQAGAQKGEMQGTQMPSLTEWQQKGAMLTPAQKELFNTGMHYGNEIDNRFSNFNSMRGTTGFLPTDEQTRVNFKDKDLSELHTGLNAALADPHVKQLMDTAKMQTDAMADMMVAHGQMSIGDAQRLKNAHKYYVPSSDMDNIVENPMNSRNLTPYSGSDTLPDVFELRDQHDYQLHKMIDDNNARDMLITGDANHVNRNPTAPQTFTPNKDPTTGAWVPANDKSTLAVRRNGELQHWNVSSRAFSDAISGSMGQADAVTSAVNKVRQIKQSSMTGAISVIFGHLFPVINAARSAGEISVLRPKGMVGSHLEKWTGGRIQADPITPYLGTAYHMAVDPAAEMTRALGEMFSPHAPNGINTRMRAMFGDAGFNAISQRAIAAYNLSNRAKMRAEGLLSSAGMTANDVSSSSNDLFSLKKKALMPSFDMVPELFQPNRLAGTMPYIVHLRNLFSELKGAIGDAAHSNFDSLNRGNPNITDAQRRFEVRNITGDPGTSGANPIVNHFLGKWVPFGNVSAQEGARVARAVNEDFGGFLSRFGTHYGSIALASAFSAMIAGPKAVQHLFDSNSDAQRSSEANLYNPLDAENPIRLPIQINMRPAYNLMVQFFHDALGMFSHSDDPNLAGHVMDAMANFFSKHVWQSTWHGTLKGISDGIIPITPAGSSEGNTILNKRTLEINLYNAVMNSGKDTPFSYPLPGDSTHIPGQSGTIDPITGTATGEMLQHVISDIFAIGGMTAMHAVNQGARQIKSGEGDISDVISNAFQAYRMNVADSVPGGSTLWNIPEKKASSTPLMERVQDALTVMRPTSTFKTDARWTGFTRSGGQQVPVAPDDSNVSKDPTMIAMRATTSKFMTMLETAKASPLKEVSDIRKEIQSLDRSPLSPMAVRIQKNELIQKEQEAYVRVQAQVYNLNGALSAIAGVPVDIRRVDFSKGPEQFRKQ